MNITAEISTKAFAAFQDICHTYTEALNRSSSWKQIKMNIDLDAIRSHTSFERQEWENQSEKFSIDQQLSSEKHVATESEDRSITIPNNVVVELIDRVDKYLIRSDERVRTEQRILELISLHLRALHPGLIAHQYGSTTYGFGGHVDLNIWIETGKYVHTNTDAEYNF